MVDKQRARGWGLIAVGAALVLPQVFASFPSMALLWGGAIVALVGGVRLADNPKTEDE